MNTALLIVILAAFLTVGSGILLHEVEKRAWEGRSGWNSKLFSDNTRKVLHILTIVKY